MVEGARQWIPFEPLQTSDDDFPELGEAFALTGAETRGQVGAAPARLMRARAIVDFAVTWLEQNRR